MQNWYAWIVKKKSTGEDGKRKVHIHEYQMQTHQIEC